MWLGIGDLRGDQLIARGERERLARLPPHHRVNREWWRTPAIGEQEIAPLKREWEAVLRPPKPSLRHMQTLWDGD